MRNHISIVARLSFIACILILLPLVSPKIVFAQDDPGGAPQSPNHARRMGVFGKITAIHADSFEVAGPEGSNVIVKLTESTEFRKDRQPVKRADFKVGDMVFVRGEQNPDHTWTAQMVGMRTGNAPEGRERFFGPQGTLGKDFVVGEVKAIDAPKITVLRSDNVTQAIELNEETSLRKGRESVTMADVQVGDHVFARGAMQNDVFVPKMVMVIAPEQWKRMQEMGGFMSSGPAPAKPEKSPEPHN
jgi:Domain of unknown function (DUF5666)